MTKPPFRHLNGLANDRDDYAAHIPLIALIVLLTLIFFLTRPSSGMMGALCGKQSNEHFASPGRTLDAAPPAQKTSAVPASARKATGAARTLGANSGSEANITAATSSRAARNQAAEAAERRVADAKKSQGKLAAQLNKEKGATQAELLKRQVEENKGHRVVDANTEALRHE